MKSQKSSIRLAVLLMAAVASCSLSRSARAAEWQIPADAPLLTRWSKLVGPDNALPEYPRPQLVRETWKNLNGLWDYAITSKADERRPDTWNGKIMVPFPIESALSGVMKPLKPDQRLWYHRKFTVPQEWEGQRVLLHFGAVDYTSIVWLNGMEIGSHIGGYDGFTYDLTDSLKPNGPQALIVSVYDATNQVCGKQSLRPDWPGSTDYTTCSGIWQTVWLEPVPQTSIRTLVQVTDIDKEILLLTIDVANPAEGDQVEAVALDGDREVALTRAPVGGKLMLVISDAKLWWPDSPFLYDLKVTVLRKGRKIDVIKSYFGMRKVSLVEDVKGFTRIHINNKYLIEIGVLDQGYWPDGIYTAPTDEALRYDLEVMKEMHMLVSRKHVKIEPERWYYWADKLGILVWQDMPSQYNSEDDRLHDQPKSPEAARQFERELKAMVEGRRNHPSIIMWTLFNESWGQYDSYRLTRWIKDMDPTRLVNTASGFILKGCGDVMDGHGKLPPFMPGLAAVSSEGAGFGVVIKEHTWLPDKAWAGGVYPPSIIEEDESFWTRGRHGKVRGKSVELTREVIEWCTDQTMNWIRGFHRQQAVDGRSGSAKTQLTDIETECNGLLTYDRIIKVDVDKIAAAVAVLNKSKNQ